MTILSNAKYAIHHIILTYRPEEKVKPLAYKECYLKQDEEGMKRAVAIYKYEVNKHLNALIDSLRRHSKTKKAKEWEKIQVIFAGGYRESSDRLAFYISTKNKKGIEKERKILKPARLHIHVVISGICAYSVKKYIDDYWRYEDRTMKVPRHGLVEQADVSYTPTSLENRKDYIKTSNAPFTIRTWETKDF